MPLFLYILVFAFDLRAPKKRSESARRQEGEEEPNERKKMEENFVLIPIVHKAMKGNKILLTINYENTTK
jgi:hypothetical protein